MNLNTLTTTTAVAVWLWPLYKSGVTSFTPPVGKALGEGVASLIKQTFDLISAHAEPHEEAMVTGDPVGHADLFQDLIERVAQTDEGSATVKQLHREVEPALIVLLNSPRFTGQDIVEIAAYMAYAIGEVNDGNRRPKVVVFVRQMGANERLDELVKQIAFVKPSLFSNQDRI